MKNSWLFVSHYWFRCGGNLVTNNQEFVITLMQKFFMLKRNFMKYFSNLNLKVKRDENMDELSYFCDEFLSKYSFWGTSHISHIFIMEFLSNTCFEERVTFPSSLSKIFKNNCNVLQTWCGTTRKNGLKTVKVFSLESLKLKRNLDGKQHQIWEFKVKDLTKHHIMCKEQWFAWD